MLTYILKRSLSKNHFYSKNKRKYNRYYRIMSIIKTRSYIKIKCTIIKIRCTSDILFKYDEQEICFKMIENTLFAIPPLISREKSYLENRHVLLSRSSSVPFFRIPSDRSHRSFFIYRCLLSKTHTSHHYKIADYSRSQHGAVGPFYPFRLDRLERGIENGSERSRIRIETEKRVERGGTMEEDEKVEDRLSAE